MDHSSHASHSAGTGGQWASSARIWTHFNDHGKKKKRLWEFTFFFPYTHTKSHSVTTRGRLGGDGVCCLFRPTPTSLRLTLLILLSSKRGNVPRRFADSAAPRNSAVSKIMENFDAARLKKKNIAIYEAT